MHSSRKRTARFSGRLYRKGGCLPMGPGGCVSLCVWGCLPLGLGGVCLLILGPGVSVCLWVQGVSTTHTPFYHPLPPWTELLTDRCKNITLQSILYYYTDLITTMRIAYLIGKTSFVQRSPNVFPFAGLFKHLKPQIRIKIVTRCYCRVVDFVLK